jgi:hypothetical protein
MLDAERCKNMTILEFVITNDRTGVPDKRRFCACWGKVQVVRDLLFPRFVARQTKADSSLRS